MIGFPGWNLEGINLSEITGFDGVGTRARNLLSGVALMTQDCGQRVNLIPDFQGWEKYIYSWQLTSRLINELSKIFFQSHIIQFLHCFHADFSTGRLTQFVKNINQIRTPELQVSTSQKVVKSPETCSLSQTIGQRRKWQDWAQRDQWAMCTEPWTTSQGKGTSGCCKTTKLDQRSASENELTSYWEDTMACNISLRRVIALECFFFSPTVQFGRLDSCCSRVKNSYCEINETRQKTNPNEAAQQIRCVLRLRQSIWSGKSNMVESDGKLRLRDKSKGERRKPGVDNTNSRVQRSSTDWLVQKSPKCSGQMFRAPPRGQKGTEKDNERYFSLRINTKEKAKSFLWILNVFIVEVIGGISCQTEANNRIHRVTYNLHIWGRR